MDDVIADIIDKPNYRCRICGLLHFDPPWGEDGESLTYDICPCCFAESGFDDLWIANIRAYRQKWLDNGAKWHHAKSMPVGWNLEEQLSHIPEEFR